MLKNIQIIEKLSGRIAAHYPIVIELIETSDEDYFKNAWENAVDEGLVDEDDRDSYDIEIVGDNEELSDEQDRAS